MGNMLTGGFNKKRWTVIVKFANSSCGDDYEISCFKYTYINGLMRSCQHYLDSTIVINIIVWMFMITDN